MPGCLHSLSHNYQVNSTGKKGEGHVSFSLYLDRFEIDFFITFYEDGCTD
jgi:hypothetical protein